MERQKLEHSRRIVDTLPQLSRRALLAGVKAAAELIAEEDAKAGREGEELPPYGSEAYMLFVSLLQYADCLAARRQDAEDLARRAELRARLCPDDGDETGRCAYRYDLEYADGLNDGPRCILRGGHVGAHTTGAAIRAKAERRYGAAVAAELEAAARAGVVIVAPDDLTIEEFARKLGAPLV